MKRVTVVLSTAAALVLGTMTSASASATAWDCAQGHVCFWTGPNGTGSRCSWDVNDKDWTSGEVVCSWARNRNVKSVWNNSTRGSGVVFYRQPYHEGRAGCTKQGQSGNLSGTYKVMSHEWTTGSCG